MNLIALVTAIVHGYISRSALRLRALFSLQQKTPAEARVSDMRQLLTVLAFAVTFCGLVRCLRYLWFL